MSSSVRRGSPSGREIEFFSKTKQNVASACVRASPVRASRGECASTSENERRTTGPGVFFLNSFLFICPADLLSDATTARDDASDFSDRLCHFFRRRRDDSSGRRTAVAATTRHRFHVRSRRRRRWFQRSSPLWWCAAGRRRRRCRSNGNSNGNSYSYAIRPARDEADDVSGGRVSDVGAGGGRRARRPVHASARSVKRYHYCNLTATFITSRRSADAFTTDPLGLRNRSSVLRFPCPCCARRRVWTAGRVLRLLIEVSEGFQKKKKKSVDNLSICKKKAI